jgi:ketopantoate reductase
MKTSMQRDFERGHRVELEELTGTVVRLGGRLGVSTPAFAVLYAVLKARAPERPGGDAG